MIGLGLSIKKTKSAKKATPIFDNASVVYSVRKPDMTTSWTNAALQVRRSSDDATAYVFYDNDGFISDSSLISTSSNTSPDVTTLSTWMGSDDLFVRSWYGVTPNNTIDTNKVMLQTTNANQPQLADAGTIITKSSYPMVNFLGGTCEMTCTANSVLNSGSEFTIFSLTHNDTANSGGSILSTRNVTGGVNDRFLLLNNRSNANSGLIKNSAGTTVTTTLDYQRDQSDQRIQTTHVTSSAINTYLDGAINDTLAWSGSYTNDILRFGAQYSNLTPLSGGIQEIAIFAGDYTSLNSRVNNSMVNSFKILPIILEATNLASAVNSHGVAWLYVYKATDYPVVTTSKDYFGFYSTDHHTSTGGIYYFECDTPRLEGFTGNTLIWDGYQAEYPWLMVIPTAESGLVTDTVFIYFHTSTADPANSGDQLTHVITHPGGDLTAGTWTDRGVIVPSEGTEDHTGYGKVWKRGVGDYIMQHKWGTVGVNADVYDYKVSTSPDGLVWTRETQFSGADFGTDGWNTPHGLEVISNNGYAIIRDLATPRKLSIVTVDQYNIPQTLVKNVYTMNYTPGGGNITAYFESGYAYIYIRAGADGDTIYYLKKISISEYL